MLVCFESGPSNVVGPTHQGKGGGPLFWFSVSHPASKAGSIPLCSKTEGHTCIALGPRTRNGWQWSTKTSPGLYLVHQLMSYAKVSAASMEGMCEKAIVSAESHLVVFMIGWLCSMSKRACWKEGKWSNVSGSSSQNLHSSDTSSGYILLCR